MPTLIGKELFGYLDSLQSELRKKKDNSVGFLKRIHSHMYEIIEKEKDFLNYVNPNKEKAILAISPNGFPSVHSLNPDLEKICELANENFLFRNIAQKFKKKIEKEDELFYVTIAENEWNEKYKNQYDKESISNTEFSIDETEDRKFKLIFNEKFFLKRGLKYFEELPTLIRKTEMQYDYIKNNLIEENKTIFYVQEISKILNNFTKNLNLFKRKVMGLKKECIKSLDELADSFSDLKIITNRGKAIEFIRLLSKGIGIQIKYNKNPKYKKKYLSFSHVQNEKGEWGKAVRILLNSEYDFF